MTRLNIEEKRRDHRDSLLTGDVTSVGLVNEEVLELAERFLLAESLLGNGELPSEGLRVPVRWGAVSYSRKSGEQEGNTPVEGMGRRKNLALVLDAGEEGNVNLLDVLLEGRRSPRYEKGSALP